MASAQPAIVIVALIYSIMPRPVPISKDILEKSKTVTFAVDGLCECQALWEIVGDSSGFSDGDIEQGISETDLRDGVADGKVTRSGRQCGNCGRTVSARHNRCLYCGTIPEEREIF